MGINQDQNWIDDDDDDDEGKQNFNLATMKDALNHSWIDLIWGLGRVNYKKHYSLHHQSSNMEKFTFDLAIGKKLHTEQELDNAVYKIAMKVVKVTTKQLKIPCMLLFSCSSKAKINCLKELLESKMRR